LQIGSKFEIFSRQYTLVDYGDDKTRNMFQPVQGKGFLLVKPDGYPYLGKIIDSILNEDLIISKIKMAYMDKPLSQHFAQQSCGGDTQIFKQSVQSLTQDVCTGIEIEGDDAVGILNVL
jgi:nucleoside diphosphate kinase